MINNTSRKIWTAFLTAILTISLFTSTMQVGYAYENTRGVAENI